MAWCYVTVYRLGGVSVWKQNISSLRVETCEFHIRTLFLFFFSSIRVDSKRQIFLAVFYFPVGLTEENGSILFCPLKNGHHTKVAALHGDLSERLRF